MPREIVVGDYIRLVTEVNDVLRRGMVGKVLMVNHHPSRETPHGYMVFFEELPHFHQGLMIYYSEAEYHYMVSEEDFTALTTYIEELQA